MKVSRGWGRWCQEIDAVRIYASVASFDTGSSIREGRAKLEEALMRWRNTPFHWLAHSEWRFAKRHARGAHVVPFTSFRTFRISYYRMCHVALIPYVHSK